MDIKYQLINIPLRMLSLLPMRVLFILSDFIYLIIYRVVSYRKKVVTTNLKNAFPDKSEEEINKIRQGFYHYLCDFFIENLKTFTISRKGTHKHYRVTNPELLESYYKQGKSVIAVLGHYNNWEWMTTLPELCSLDCYVTYKPLSNKIFDKLFFRSRGKHGMKPVSMKNTPRAIVAGRTKPSLFALIADQTPTKTESKYWTKFLNQDTLIFMGPEKLARSSNFPVVFLRIDKVKRGVYECTFIPLEENPKLTQEGEITEKHVRMLESIIKENPENWLWSHRRWKHKKNDQ